MEKAYVLVNKQTNKEMWNIKCYYLICVCATLMFAECTPNLCTNHEEYNPSFEDEHYPNSGDIPLLNRKIFKGKGVTILEHPYIASIRRNFAHYLVGVILTKNCLITVADPLYRVPTYELNVVVGETYADRGTHLLNVVFVIIHHEFDPHTMNADIALVRLYEDIVFRVSVKPIALVGRSINGSKALVTGWGRCDWTDAVLCLPRTSMYFPDERFDSLLRSVSFTITAPSSYCEEYTMRDNKILPGMLCGGPAREERELMPCLAIPGAPLVVHGHLAGVQSWGIGCAFKKDLPLIYTDVAYYSQWLKESVGILKNVKRSNLTSLHKATLAKRMLILYEKTRKYKPTTLKYTGTHIVPLNIDEALASLDASVYDVRDFIHESVNRNKTNMYSAYKKHIKLQYNISMIKNQMLSNVANVSAFLTDISEVDFS